MCGLLKGFVNLIVEGGNDELGRRSGPGVDRRWANERALKIVFVRGELRVVPSW